MQLPSYDILLLIFAFLVKAIPSMVVVVVPMNSPIGTEKTWLGYLMFLVLVK